MHQKKKKTLNVTAKTLKSFERKSFMILDLTMISWIWSKNACNKISIDKLFQIFKFLYIKDIAYRMEEIFSNHISV
jgi:hypothetical protein